MTDFNLVDEPWISVNLLNGKHDVVSLREAFSRAREIRSIECDNPMQTAAVTRLVLAVMYRAMTPLFESQKRHAKNADVTLWKMLWDDKSGALDSSVSGYLDKWQNRFDIFDKKRPFFQIAGLEYSSANEGKLADVKRSLGKIMPDSELISVFRNSAFNTAVSYAEAARVLITYQSWSTLAPLSPVVGIYPDDEFAVPRVYPKGHRGWCSSIGVTLLTGRTLYETLMLNFVPIQLNSADIPFWEERVARKVPVLFEMNEDVGKPVLKKRNAKPVGQVQLFVWFAKSVRLVESDGKVIAVVASEHDSLSSKSSQVYMARHHETQTSWRETETGEMAAYHFMGDSVWQNVPALIPRTREGFLAPLNVTWAAKVTNILGIQLPARIRIIGGSTDDRAQTFRGVIDKSITVSSLSKLDDPSVTAKIEDTATTMNKLVRTNYYGFSRDSLMARYGEVSDSHLESLMHPANNALDKAFAKLFRTVTAETASESTSEIVGSLAADLANLSFAVAEQSSSNELLGTWKITNGEKRIYSVAASRNRLLRALRAFYQNDIDIPEEGASVVRWVIKNNISSTVSSLPITDIERSVIDFWSKRKTLVDGKSSHINQKGLYASLSALQRDNGNAFDERVCSLLEATSESGIVESLRRIAGVVNSKGSSIDFGNLSSLGSLLAQKNRRVEAAQILVEKNNRI